MLLIFFFKNHKGQSVDKKKERENDTNMFTVYSPASRATAWLAFDSLILQ